MQQVKIKYLTQKEINRQAWDHCLDESSPSLIQAYSWYLDIICKNWDALVCEENGKYVACFPVPWKRKAGIKYVYPPYFAQQLGLFSQQKFLVEPFLHELNAKFSFVELYLNYNNEGFGSPKTNLILNLNHDYNDLYSNFNKNHQRNLKKAENNSLFIEKTNNIQSVIELFKNNRGKKVKNLRKSDYKIFESCCLAVAKKGECKILKVFSTSKELLAGGIFFIHQNRITFVFSGLSEEGKKMGALFLLINHIIMEYQNSPFILDFEGSENPGIKSFYEGFGATHQPYFFYKNNRLPFPFNKLKK